MPIDKEQFLTQPIEGATSDSFVPVPEDEYICQVLEVKEPEDKMGKNGWNCWVDVSWEIVDEEKLKKVQDITGKKKPTIRQRLFLDVIRDGSDKVTGMAGGEGKNVGLGQIRTATNLNNPSKRFTWKHLEGQMARVRVEHSVYNDRPMAQVAFMGVTKM